MTPLQIIIWTCAYLIELVVVIYFAHPTARRVVGAMFGGAAGGLLGMVAVALGKAQGWWQIPFESTSYFLPLFYLGLSISLTPVYIVTWRLARRFKGRGLAVFLAVVGIIGPPRDYLIARTFPRWMVFGSGVSPILADAVTYLGMIALGHAVMYLVAGPSSEDRLARETT